MLIDLHSLKISLSSDDERVLKLWQQLFYYELIEPASTSIGFKPHIILELDVVCHLPPSPDGALLYQTSDPEIIVFHNQARQLLLRYSDVGHIQWQLMDNWQEAAVETAHIAVDLAESAVNSGALEDLTGMGLAPLLRRRGLFLIHAFAAAHDQESVLFVGPSGCGKTSCGLALLAAGWQYLANDLALLSAFDEPAALLSPGTVQVTPDTFSRLGQFGMLAKRYNVGPERRKLSIPRQEFMPTDDIIRIAPIKAIFFPSLGTGAGHQIKEVSRAVGFARLLSSSMDRWDHEIWEEHLGFLEHLSETVDFYDLILGADMFRLPGVLHRFLTDHQARQQSMSIP